MTSCIPFLQRSKRFGEENNENNLPDEFPLRRISMRRIRYKFIKLLNRDLINVVMSYYRLIKLLDPLLFFSWQKFIEERIKFRF